MKKYVMRIMAIAFIMALVAIPAFSQQDTNTAKEEKAPAQAPAPTPEMAKSAEASIYGEVQAVNESTTSITVQYYDYDNDEEKTLEVATDKDTKLENVKAIGEIRKGDWVDVTYTASGGKNTAKMVSVEKEEPAAEETAPAPAEE